MCQFVIRVFQYFSKTSYKCVMCGARSGHAEALCFPEEQTFEE